MPSDLVANLGYPGFEADMVLLSFINQSLIGMPEHHTNSGIVA